jgi:hypothetical protein
MIKSGFSLPIGEAGHKSPKTKTKSVMKQRTKGMFTDSVDSVLRDPGLRLKQERNLLLEANPEL